MISWTCPVRWRARCPSSPAAGRRIWPGGRHRSETVPLWSGTRARPGAWSCCQQGSRPRRRLSGRLMRRSRLCISRGYLHLLRWHYDAQVRTGIAVDDDFHAAMMRIDVFADDGESQTGAFYRPGVFGAALIERFEYEAAILRKNARAFVHDVDDDIRPAPAQLHLDRASAWRKFDRVRQQIVHDRFHLVLVGLDVELGCGQIQAQILGAHRQGMLLG